MASNEYSYGGQVYSFTDPVGRIFECPICQGVVKEAQSVRCCKKTFCKSCLHEALKRSSTCPLCRSADPAAYDNEAIDGLVNDLKVLCLHHGKGCEWSGHLLHESQHREKCGYEEVECENQGLLNVRCGAVCERRHMKKHMEEECECRRAPCKFCSQLLLVVWKDLHAITCPEHPVECVNGCRVKRLLRKNIVVHREVCPEAVVDCPFKEMGCSEGRLKRKDMQSHTTKAVSDHLALVMKNLVETKQAMRQQAYSHKTETDSLKANIEQLRIEVDAFRTGTKGSEAHTKPLKLEADARKGLKACMEGLKVEVQAHSSKTEHQKTVGKEGRGGGRNEGWGGGGGNFFSGLQGPSTVPTSTSAGAAPTSIFGEANPTLNFAFGSGIANPILSQSAKNPFLSSKPPSATLGFEPTNTVQGASVFSAAAIKNSCIVKRAVRRGKR